jgi:hypothetical protein
LENPLFCPHISSQNLNISFLTGWDWVHLELRPPFWPTVPAPHDNDCGAIGGMRIGRGNQSTQRKPVPVPLCPPQMPHALTWAWTKAATVGRWRLTALMIFDMGCTLKALMQILFQSLVSPL